MKQTKIISITPKNLVLQNFVYLTAYDIIDDKVYCFIIVLL